MSRKKLSWFDGTTLCSSLLAVGWRVNITNAISIKSSISAADHAHEEGRLRCDESLTFDDDVPEACFEIEFCFSPSPLRIEATDISNELADN